MIIDQELCVQCESCIPYCPVNAIKSEGGEVFISQEECVECKGCLRAEVCPVDAIKFLELSWPRSLRNSFSDPLGVHKSTNHKGRGTEEVKTNDVTGLVKPGFAGLALELGRPSIGAYFRDVEKVAMALAPLPYVTFAEKNPVTSFIVDKATGKMRDDILNERVLSAIVEFIVPEDKVKEAVDVIKEVAKTIDTVFSFVAFYAVGPNGEYPLPEVYSSLGLEVSPAGKTNLGLGRPLIGGRK